MIDAHHHFLDPGLREYPWLTGAAAAIDRPRRAADLEPLLDKHGITGTVLVQTLASREETLDLLAVSVERPWIAGVVGWVDLAADDVADQIAWLQAASGGHRLVGIRHGIADEPDARWILQRSVLRGLDAVAEAGLVFDLEVRARELPAVRAAVSTLPQLGFVLDHAGKPPISSGRIENWKVEIALLAAFPNVSCKLSGLVTEASWPSWTLQDLEPAAKQVIRRFGPERVMFGSDWPVCELAADYATVFRTARRLSGDHWDAISGRTAARVYGLAPATVPSAHSDDTEVTPS